MAVVTYGRGVYVLAPPVVVPMAVLAAALVAVPVAVPVAVGALVDVDEPDPEPFLSSVTSSPTVPSWPKMKLMDKAVELMTLSLLKP